MKKAAPHEMQRAMTAYTIAAVVFCLLIFILPPNATALHLYHITAFQYRVVLFSVTLPSLLVWFAAFWGYAKLQHYANSLPSSQEGEYYKTLAKGCAWLAWSLPLTLLATIFINGLAAHSSVWHSSAIVLGTYLKLVPVLVAFTLVGTAARGLLQQTGAKIGLAGTRLIMLVFALGGVLYCYLLFRHINLGGGLSDTHNPYALPLWLLVVTVIVPFLYAWFVGLLAAYEISLFSAHVSGVLYRRALSMLVMGLVAVIVSSIVVQYITGLEAGRGYFSLDGGVLVLTVFRLLEGLGFLLMAFGADRLKKIEEV